MMFQTHVLFYPPADAKVFTMFNKCNRFGSVTCIGAILFILPFACFSFMCNKAYFIFIIQQQAQKANRLVGVIRRNFQNLTPSNFTLLFKTLIRPIIEYAAPVWHPYLKQTSKQ